MERPQGNIVRSLDSKSLYGRAWAGVLDNLRPASWEWAEDTRCSVICAQIAHQDVANQGGITVGVSWQASIDPSIPGGRYSVSRVDRRQVIAEVAQMCGARVRTSLDGLSLEVYDAPARDGSEPVVRTYTEAFAPLNYELRRVDQIANCVRVMGEKLNYTTAALPVVSVQVIPGAIDADGESVANARARVYDSAGDPVQHTAIVDEAIAAGSYTEIPVSGCFSVQGVWLNVGTAEDPVKGTRIDPESFTASVITVPAQATQLFIVSYTQAQAVSWGSALVTNEIRGEAQATTGLQAVSTDQPIGRVVGVYRATDTNRVGTNYFTGGSAVAGGTSIILGIKPGAIGTAVIVDYDEFEASASVNLSPASSLCDSEGWAQTTVGAGNIVGLVQIIASALGQEGRAALSLLGDAIGSLQVTADPDALRAEIRGQMFSTLYSDEVATLQASGSDKYIEVDNQIASVGDVAISGYGAIASRWQNDGSTHRIYITTDAPVGSSVVADYFGTEYVDEADQTSTITAMVLTASGDPVTDGTEVTFALVGSTGGATLSATKAVTADGIVSITLTAKYEATFSVRVTAGPYIANVQIAVAESVTPTDIGTSETADGTESTGLASGGSSPADGAGSKDSEAKTDLEDGEYKRADGRVCHLVLKDWEDASGNIRGRRLAKGCDGVLPFAKIIIDGAVEVTTDAEGYFYFSVAAAGSHTATYNNIEKTFSVAAGGDMRWTPGSSDRWYEVCRDE
ncbi:MAG: hypothetical protein AB7D06_17260 [Pedobacter sp.]